MLATPLPRVSNVNEEGVLVRIPPDGEATEHISWIGEPTKDTRIVDGQEHPITLYSSLSVYGDVVEIGDCVYLHPEDLDMPCEIGMVTRFFEDHEGEKNVTARWFWRPDHLAPARGFKLEHKREVFLSETSDDNPAGAIERRVKLYHLPKTDRLDPSLLDAPDTFFYRRFYDPQTGNFTSDAPREGKCLSAPPYNPPEPPPAKRVKKSPEEGRVSGFGDAHSALEDAEAKRAFASLLEKVERNQKEVAGKIEEVNTLIKAIAGVAASVRLLH